MPQFLRITLSNLLVMVSPSLFAMDYTLDNVDTDTKVLPHYHDTVDMAHMDTLRMVLFASLFSAIRLYLSCAVVCYSWSCPPATTDVNSGPGPVLACMLRTWSFSRLL